MRKMPQQPPFIPLELLLLPKLSVLAFWKLQVSIHMFDIFKLSTRPKILKSSPTKRPKCCNNGARWTAKNSPSKCSSGPNELFELWQGGETPREVLVGIIFLGWEVTDWRYLLGILLVCLIYLYTDDSTAWGLCLNLNFCLSNTCVLI